MKHTTKRALMTLAPLQVLAMSVMSGCARGPEDGGGGPGTPQAINRMTVTMQLQQAIDQPGQNYFYAFAFDDDDRENTGPVALIGPSSFVNGIVGGDFTVLVQYRAGQFTVFRRTRQGNSERLERVPNPFVTAPPNPRGGPTITFTLNLDATYTEESTGRELRLFRGPNGGLPQNLDINFVTTNDLSRDPNNLVPRAFDALYPATPGRWLTLRNIQSSQVFDNQQRRVEPTGDVQGGGTTRDVNLPALDITNFRVEVLRSSS